MYTPVNPSFTIEKWGLRGSKLYRHDEFLHRTGKVTGKVTESMRAIWTYLLKSVYDNTIMSVTKYLPLAWPRPLHKRMRYCEGSFFFFFFFFFLLLGFIILLRI